MNHRGIKYFFQSDGGDCQQMYIFKVAYKLDCQSLEALSQLRWAAPQQLLEKLRDRFVLIANHQLTERPPSETPRSILTSRRVVVPRNLTSAFASLRHQFQMSLYCILPTHTSKYFRTHMCIIYICVIYFFLKTFLAKTLAGQYISS